MPRKPRIHYPGAIYHVIARGNNRENVLAMDVDKKRYLDLVQKYKERFWFSLYGYVIMDNHVHLLIEVENSSLSKIMQGIQQSYTQYYNRLYGRVGHVFQQRYIAMLCERDQYLLTLLKYIHNNSVRAGLTSTMDYKWSSHHYYLEGNSSLVNTHFCLGLFAQDMKLAIQRYSEFMNQLEPIEIKKEIVQGYLVDPTTQIKDKDGNKFDSRINFEQIVDIVSEKNGIADAEKALLSQKSRIRKIVAARNMVIYIAIHNELANRKEISNRLSVTPYQITRGYYEATQNKESQVIINEIEKEIRSNNAITQA